MSLASLYNTTCGIYRATNSTDAMGSTVERWEAVATGVACRIGAPTQRFVAREREISSAPAVEVSRRLYCEVQDVLEGDEIRVGTSIYRVTGVYDVQLMGHHMEIDLTEHRPDRHGR